MPDLIGRRVRIVRDARGWDRRVHGFHEEGTAVRMEPGADGEPPVYLVRVSPGYDVYCTADMLEDLIETNERGRCPTPGGLSS